VSNIILLAKRGHLQIPSRFLKAKAYLIKKFSDGRLLLIPLVPRKEGELGFTLNTEEISYFITRGATL